MIQETIREHAITDPRIANLIADRWYGPNLPLGTKTYPAVTMAMISNVQTVSHQGHSGLETARFQMDIWSDCFNKALKLASYIESRFRPSTVGEMGGPNYLARVGYVQRIGRTDLGLDIGLKVYRLMLEFYMHYEVLP